MGQCQINICHFKGIVKMGVMYKYEVTTLNSKKVMANVWVFWQFDLQGQYNLEVKVKYEYTSVKALSKELLCPRMK